jgi:hypothetical protein
MLMIFPLFLGMKCFPAAWQITKSEFRFTFITCALSADSMMTYMTHIIPLLQLHIYGVGSLEHSAIIDQDIQVIDNC